MENREEYTGGNISSLNPSICFFLSLNVPFKDRSIFYSNYFNKFLYVVRAF